MSMKFTGQACLNSILNSLKIDGELCEISCACEISCDEVFFFYFLASLAVN